MNKTIAEAAKAAWLTLMALAILQHDEAPTAAARYAEDALRSLRGGGRNELGQILYNLERSIRSRRNEGFQPTPEDDILLRRMRLDMRPVRDWLRKVASGGAATEDPRRTEEFLKSFGRRLALSGGDYYHLATLAASWPLLDQYARRIASTRLSYALRGVRADIAGRYDRIMRGNRYIFTPPVNPETGEPIRKPGLLAKIGAFAAGYLAGRALVRGLFGEAARAVPAIGATRVQRPILLYGTRNATVVPVVSYGGAVLLPDGRTLPTGQFEQRRLEEGLRFLGAVDVDTYVAAFLGQEAAREHYERMKARLGSASLLAETATAGATASAAVATLVSPIGSAGFDPAGWWRSIYPAPPSPSDAKRRKKRRDTRRRQR